MVRRANSIDICSSQTLNGHYRQILRIGFTAHLIFFFRVRPSRAKRQHQMAKVTYTAPSQTYEYSSSAGYGYYLQNNAWGAGNLTYGVDYSTSVTYDPANFQGGVTFSWMFPQNVGGVYAYPHIDFEAWAADISTSQAGNISNLVANYDATLTNKTNSTLAFDLWFNSEPNGSWSTTSVELLIELHPTSAGSPNQSFQLTGANYTGATVYVSNASAAGASWKFIDVKMPSDMMSGPLDLSDIIKQLIWNGVLTGKEYLTSLQLGSEVQGGTGSLQLNASYDWTANPSLIGTAGNDSFVITSSGGNQVLGNGGVDTVTYTGLYSNYQIRSYGTETLVTYGNNISSLDELDGVTFIKFSDGTYNTVTASFVSNVTGQAPLAPRIGSFSPDTRIVGDGITNANRVTLAGTADANTTVKIFDGTTQIGTAAVDATGAWSFMTGLLADGTHKFAGIDVNAAGQTSAASDSLSVTVDTRAPTVTARLASDTGSSSTDKITSNPTLTGAGDPNAVVTVSEGSTTLGTTVADANGKWTFKPFGLGDGSHVLLVSETDAAGNTGTASLAFNLDTVAPVPTITGETLKNGKLTLTGTTMEANDKISIYDGSTLIGTTTTDSNGGFNFATGNLSRKVHVFTVTATDLAGNVGQGSNDVILGTSSSETLTGSSGNDIIIGNGGNDTFIGGAGADTLIAGGGRDSFVFRAISDATPASYDTILNFDARNDVINFSGIAGINAVKGVATFQGLLTGSGNMTLNAHSIGYVEVGGNTVVLVNTTNNAETVTALDTHAVNMQIVLAGTHLGLTNSDFHVI
jgi:Bacterial Ig-like domain/RTX calcium-binding nonapeptide repeat (4 copies)